MLMYTSCFFIYGIILTTFELRKEQSAENMRTYEGGNFNSGNYLFTTDTK